MNFSDIISAGLKVRWIIAVAAILGGLGYKFAPMIWHKSAPKNAPTTVAAKTGTNSPALKPGGYYLGELTMTNHQETCVRLRGGKSFTLLPRSTDGRNVELTLSLESRTNDGLTHDLSVTQVNAKSGKPVEIALGDCDLSFTPKISN